MKVAAPTISASTLAAAGLTPTGQTGGGGTFIDVATLITELGTAKAAEILETSREDAEKLLEDINAFRKDATEVAPGGTFTYEASLSLTRALIQ